MSNIFLSIVITNFNKAKYLNECLNSITKQNLANIELILIDDNSKDQSRKILKKYKNKIKIIYNKKNIGPSASRNIGIKIASGTYITFVDADDKIFNCLSKIIKNIVHQRNKSDLILLKYLSTNQSLNNYNYFLNQKKLFQKFSTDLFIKKKIYILNQHESVWYIFFRNNFLKKNKILFLEKSNCFEDLDFVVRSILLSKFIGLLNIKYYFYRELKNSLKKNFSIDRVLGALSVYRSLENFKKKKLTPIKTKFLKLRLEFVKNIFILRYYLLNKNKHFTQHIKIQKYVHEIKKKAIKKFKIKENDKIAIYCYGPSGKFLFKLLNELNLNKIIFVDDYTKFINKTIKNHKIYKLNQVIKKNYKIIIANPKRSIISNIRKKNKEIKMLEFNINDFYVSGSKNNLF